MINILFASWFQPLSGLLSLIGTFILIFITTLYVIFTYWLLKESRLGNKISRLPILGLYLKDGHQIYRTADVPKKILRIKNIGNSIAFNIKFTVLDVSGNIVEDELQNITRSDKVGYFFIDHNILIPKEEISVGFSRDNYEKVSQKHFWLNILNYPTSGTFTLRLEYENLANEKCFVIYDIEGDNTKRTIKFVDFGPKIQK